MNDFEEMLGKKDPVAFGMLRAIGGYFPVYLTKKYEKEFENEKEPDVGEYVKEILEEARNREGE